MAEKVKIIYVEDAERFKRFPFLNKDYAVSPEHGESVGIRKAYKNLVGKVGELPKKVGVVSFDWISKALAANDSEDHGRIEGYVPLVLLRKMLDLEQEEKQGAMAEYIYRTLMFNFMHGAFIDENQNRKAFTDAVFTAHIYVNFAANSVDKVIERFSGSEDRDDQETRSQLKEAREALESLPNWPYLKQRYEETLVRFRKNKVSEDFPLRFVPTGIRLFWCINWSFILI